MDLPRADFPFERVLEELAADVDQQGGEGPVLLRAAERLVMATRGGGPVPQDHPNYESWKRGKDSWGWSATPALLCFRHHPRDHAWTLQAHGHHKHVEVKCYYQFLVEEERPWTHQNYQWIWRIWYLTEVTNKRFHFSFCLPQPHSHSGSVNLQSHERLNIRTHQMHFTCLRTELSKLTIARKQWLLETRDHNWSGMVMFAILFYGHSKDAVFSLTILGK